MANRCGCNDTYNGNCNCSEPIDLLTAIAVGPTGATGATGADGADGEAVWYDTAGTPVQSIINVITEQTLNTYIIDNTPTVALGNGDVLYLEAFFIVMGASPNNREVRIKLGGITLVSYIFPGGSLPAGFYSIELHVELHKVSNTSQICTSWVDIYGSPDTIIHSTINTIAVNFVNDVTVETTCICSVAAAAGNVNNIYFMIKRAKHI